MEEILLRIFGGYSLIDVIIFSWFILLGYIYRALDETSLRNKESKNTPKQWSWFFWFKDNWRRYVVSIIATYVIFRFYIEIIGHELTDFEAFMIGLTGDNIGNSAKQRIGTIKNRDKLKQKDVE